MRYQQRPYSCGAAAVVNALRCYGKRIPEKLVRSRAGTTKKDGTQEEPMNMASQRMSISYQLKLECQEQKQNNTLFSKP